MPIANQLNDFPLGELDAESDPLLLKCFIKTSGVQSALAFGRGPCIIVGKKGSGKTAILRRGLGARTKTPCLRISPKTHTIEIASASTSYAQVADLLGYELRLDALNLLLETEATAAKLDATLRSDIASVTGDYVGKAKKAAGTVKGFQAFGFGLTLGDAERRPLQIKAKREVDELDTLLDRTRQAGAKCLILMDDPELVLSTETPIQPNVLGAVLMAATDLSKKHPQSVRAVVLLKLHIYQWIWRRFEDMDKLRQSVSMLRWSDDELVELLACRLREADVLGADRDARDVWRVLLSESQMGPSDLEKYVLDRLVAGPRDLIWYANLILRSQRSKAGGEALAAAEAEYSGDLLAAIEREYSGRGYEGISAVIESIYEEATPAQQEMSREDYVDFLKTTYRSERLKKLRELHPWLEDLITEKLAELLFEVGLLSYQNPDSRYVRPYEPESELASFVRAASWRVSPGFQMELGLSG